MEVDVAVIGAGPGGYVAALRAAELGLKTICIEKGKTLGGTCLNIGCIPSKALLQSSQHYAWSEHHAQEHGIAVTGLSLKWQQMQKRKNEVVKSLVRGVAGLFANAGVEHLQGTATFEDPHALKVGKERVEAKQIILATGSEAVALPFLPFDEKTIVSSTGALALKKVPKKLAVIGAGVIGVELASVYRRLGSEVTIIEMLDVICPAMDSAVSKELMKLLQGQGIDFVLGTKVEKRVKRTLYTSSGKKVEADVVLVAIGRRPYSEGLGLEAVGIELSPQGTIAVDQNFRTQHPHIYAIGDLIEGPMLAHRASDEGLAVAEFIAGHHPTVNYMALPNVIYTHPEVAAVGLTEEELKATGRAYLKGVSYFRANGRARCAGDTDGFVKILAEKRSGRLLGMHIIGPQASEMIGEAVLAIEKQMTAQELAHTSHAHPTLSETIKEAALLIV